MILKRLIISLIVLCFASAQASVKTFVVTSTETEGKGSLYNIVQEINELEESDSAKITFDILASSTKKLEVPKNQESNIPELYISRYTIIDGSNYADTIQASIVFNFGGYLNNLILDGNKLNIPNPITLLSGDFSVKNCTISNFGGYSIQNNGGHITEIIGCKFSNCSGPVIYNTSVDGIESITDCKISSISNPVIHNETVIGLIKNIECSNVKYGIYGYKNSKIKNITNYHSDTEKESHLTGLTSISESSFGGTTYFEDESIAIKSCTFNNLSINKECDSIIDCTINESAIFYGNVTIIDSCTFKKGARTSSKVSTIKNCNIKGTLEATKISTIRNCIFNEGELYGLNTIGQIVSCKFSNCANYAINSKEIGVIDSCVIENCKTGIYKTLNINTISNSNIKDCDIAISECNPTHMFNCSITNNKTGIYIWGANYTSLENCTIQNNGYGLLLENSHCGLIKNCIIDNNGQYAIKAGSAPLDSIINCTISNCKIGLDLQACTVSLMDSCYILNDSIGISNTSMSSVLLMKNTIIRGCEAGISLVDHNTYTLENCIIGKNVETDEGNKIGITGTPELNNLTLKNCILSGNDNYGIYFSIAQIRLYIDSCLIGTNTYRDSIGNGKDGIYISGANCEMGITNSTISNNGGNGITEGVKCIIRDSKFENNRKYGFSDEIDKGTATTITSCYFDSNGHGGINNTQKNYKRLMSQNLFINTNGQAITNAYQQETPVIKKVTEEKKGVLVTGTAGPNAKIELFLSYGESQTANEFIDSVFADGNGGFIYKVAKKYNDHLKFCISATATFNGNTSELSDPFCWYNSSLMDTLYLSDTVCAQKVYTGHGFNIDLTGLESGNYEYERADTSLTSITRYVLQLSVNPATTLFNVSTRKALCSENGGTATAVVTKGNGPFTFAWRLGGKVVAEDSVLLHMLTDTAYTLTVTDANGCASTQSDIRTTLEELPLLNNLKLTTNVQGQQCYGIDNGRITVAFKGNSNKSALKLTAAGKKGVTKSAASSAASGKFVIDSLAPGSYQLFLDYDAEGCASTPTQLQLDDVKVSEVKTQLKIDDTFTDTKNATCVSEPNGHVTVRMANWTDGYRANLYLDGELLATKDKADSTDKKYAYFTAGGLNGGTVSFVVTDVCGYSDSASIGLVRLEAPAIGIVDTVCQVALLPLNC